MHLFIMEGLSPTQIFNLLKREYPKAKIALNFRNPLELLVATILSAQCMDKQVNIVTKSLFKKYRKVEDYAKADSGTLEQEIWALGLYRNKTRNIIAAAQKILKDFGGKVPDSMDKLLQLQGVARKTANIVLFHGFRKISGIAVDTHVKRVSQRLGFTKNENPEKIEKDLMRLLPKKEWGVYNLILIQHGRKVCVSRKPKCSQCVLRESCPSKNIFSS